ncbi:MAG: hypothetical protein FJ297_12550 [Planctomycetes bacterium]|nr:hypothetical protein [Planctomycetota bacterium]
MSQGLVSTPFVGVIELEAGWRDRMVLAPDESPWERLAPDVRSSPSDRANGDAAVEVLSADNGRLRSELDAQLALLLQARRILWG